MRSLCLWIETLGIIPPGEDIQIFSNRMFGRPENITWIGGQVTTEFEHESDRDLQVKWMPRSWDRISLVCWHVPFLVYRSEPHLRERSSRPTNWWDVARERLEFWASKYLGLYWDIELATESRQKVNLRQRMTAWTNENWIRTWYMWTYRLWRFAYGRKCFGLLIWFSQPLLWAAEMQRLMLLVLWGHGLLPASSFITELSRWSWSWASVLGTVPGDMPFCGATTTRAL